MLCEGDLLEPLPEPVDIIVANLPYISDRCMAELCDDIIMFEPKIALQGGGGGTSIIERLVATAGEKLRSQGAIILEISSEQKQIISDLAKRCFPRADVEVLLDLNGNERAIVIKTSA